MLNSYVKVIGVKNSWARCHSIFRHKLKYWIDNGTLKTGHHKSYWGGHEVPFFHCSVFNIWPPPHVLHLLWNRQHATQVQTIQAELVHFKHLSFHSKDKIKGLVDTGVRWGSKSELSKGRNFKKSGKTHRRHWMLNGKLRLMRAGIANHSGGKENKDRKCDVRQMRKELQNTTGNADSRNKTYKLTRWLWIPWQHQKPLFWIMML